MQERSVVERIETLEQKVEALENLPARLSAVESQIVQLRAEVHDEFSVLRGELTTRIDAVDARLDALADYVSARIIEGDDETRRFMRILHEEVISRIATLQEGLRA